MDTYIVRQPILNRNHDVLAYEILYREDESSLYNTRSDSVVANTIENFLLQMDDETFLNGKPAYFTFTPNLLMKNIPRMLSSEKIVIQIEDNSIIHPLSHRIIYRFKKEGYRIAVKGFQFMPRYFDILDAVDIIKVDYSNPDDPSLANIVNMGHSFQKQVIAYNVNSDRAYEQAMSDGCQYLQGSHVAEQTNLKVHKVEHLQSNFFQLMVAVTKSEPDITEIDEIISRDVTLTYSLLKLVNSAYFALRNRVKSVKQALIVLGLGQLKQWIYLLSFKRSDGAIPEELIRTSFLRANFCAELAQYISDFPVSKTEAYLMGMFSTLSALMEVPLEEALGQLAVTDEVKNALLSGEGKCGELFHLVLAYESADWRDLTQHAQVLGIAQEVVTQKYFECVEYVNGIWDSLLKPYNGLQEEEQK